jgi:hypothetical protein
MQLQGIPERFWVVTKPSEVSELADICFSATVESLMCQARGGLRQADIVGIYDKEEKALEVAKMLLGQNIVRSQDALTIEVIVHMLVFPEGKERTFRALSDAAVEAVMNAIQQAEEAGFQHSLKGEITMGAGPVTLKNQCAVFG